MKTKIFFMLSFILLTGICSTAFRSDAVNDDPVYMYLFHDNDEVTDGVLQGYGEATFNVQVVVSNGDWCVEYATSAGFDHISIDRHCDSSDATRTFHSDGTPGTYPLDFWLDDVKMTTLTIVIE
jgi:hypothetical protein